MNKEVQSPNDHRSFGLFVIFNFGYLKSTLYKAEYFYLVVCAVFLLVSQAQFTIKQTDLEWFPADLKSNRYVIEAIVPKKGGTVEIFDRRRRQRKQSSRILFADESLPFSKGKAWDEKKKNH